ncbi:MULTISPECIES: hypothetical protein [Mesorhizobium]|uniref:hypothetical protein n=1 Tax=Mesorhizobium erdmanii TaxID=1777866 RepID=UPI0012DB10D6
MLIEDLCTEWCSLDERIAALDAEFVHIAGQDEAARRLSTIPGIGVINATALTASATHGASGAVVPGSIWNPNRHAPDGRSRSDGIYHRGNGDHRPRPEPWLTGAISISWLPWE